MPDNIAQLAARGFLGLLFCGVAVVKLRTPGDFSAALKDYGVSGSEIRGLLTIGIPSLELVSGLALLAGWFLGEAAIVAVTLLTAFSAAVFQKLIRGVSMADCGCGLGKQPLSYSVLVRNAALVAVAAAVLFPELASILLLFALCLQALSLALPVRRRPSAKESAI
jgi:hypothetical protein